MLAYVTENITFADDKLRSSEAPAILLWLSFGEQIISKDKYSRIFWRPDGCWSMSQTWDSKENLSARRESNPWLSTRWSDTLSTTGWVMTHDTLGHTWRLLLMMFLISHSTCYFGVCHCWLLDALSNLLEIHLPVCTLICRSLGMPTRNGYPLLMKPSSNSTCSPLYHSEKKTPGTNLSLVQFQNVSVLFTRWKIWRKCNANTNYHYIF